MNAVGNTARDLAREDSESLSEMHRKRLEWLLGRIGSIPEAMNRQGRRQLQGKIKGFRLEDKIAVVGYVVSRYWTGPMTEAEQALSRERLEDLGDNVTWYHGGLAGRKPGDLLLPPSVTGADPRGLRDAIPTRMKLVYFTPKREVAQDYAFDVPTGDGKIYTVQPQSEVHADPIDVRVSLILDDYFYVPKSAFCATSAKVLKVLDW